ncbi:hypothetical protein KR52_09080 [Synechococcus sp. KORDI-52]|nr:hypothetical protein KR52_09080 [Synechococcus sp. KORDI-52]
MTPREDTQYKQQHDEPVTEKPICVRFPQSVDTYLRGLDDQSQFIRDAVAKAIEEQADVACAARNPRF